ncbi:MAG: arylsulfatase [Pseudomonadota bacterium]
MIGQPSKALSRWRITTICGAALLALVALGACGAPQTDSADPAVDTKPSLAATDQMTAEPPPEIARPNIVLILADDLGFSDVGAFGSEIHTPNIDRLAASGMMFTNFHVNTTCSPTRAMLMSGVDSHQAGYGTMPGLESPEQIGQPGYELYLNDRVAPLSELLQDAGYHTYIAGKWDLGGRNGRGKAAHERGFDRSFILVEGLADHFRPVGVYEFLAPVHYLEDGEPIELPEDFYSSKTYTDKVIEHIESSPQDGNPFFAYLAFTAPHYPLQAEEGEMASYDGVYDEGYEAVRAKRLARQQELELIDTDWVAPDIHENWPEWEALSDEGRTLEVRRMQSYAAMVEAMDRNIGRVLDYLDAQGLTENTLVMFLSDNGPDQANPLELGSEEWMAQYYSFDSNDIGKPGSFTWYGPGWASVSATPYKYHKHFMTRGGLLSPAIISFPGVVSAGSRTDALTTVMDILPTFLELAEAEHPGTEYKGQDVFPLRGASFVPLFAEPDGDVHDEDYVFALELFDRRMVQKGGWKIVWANAPWGHGDRWELYNLSADPTELRDLANVEPEKLAEMIGEWDDFVESAGVIPNEGFVLTLGSTDSHYQWLPTDMRNTGARILRQDSE